MTQDDIDQSEWNDPANWSALTYSSRKDSRIFVPKRRGFGLTINFGHKNGKIIFAALLVVPMVVFGLIFVFRSHFPKH